VADPKNAMELEICPIISASKARWSRWVCSSIRIQRMRTTCNCALSVPRPSALRIGPYSHHMTKRKMIAKAWGRSRSFGNMICSLCSPVHFLDFHGLDVRRAFQRIVQAEGGLCHQHWRSIEVIGNGKAVGRDEIIKLFGIVAGNPAHHLMPRCFKFNRHAVFICESVSQNIKLQGTNYAYDCGGAIHRNKKLNHA